MHGAGKRIALLLIVTILGLWLATMTRPVNTYRVVSNSAIEPTQRVAPEAGMVDPTKVLD